MHPGPCHLTIFVDQRALARYSTAAKSFCRRMVCLCRVDIVGRRTETGSPDSVVPKAASHHTVVVKPAPVSAISQTEQLVRFGAGQRASQVKPFSRGSDDSGPTTVACAHFCFCRPS